MSQPTASPSPPEPPPRYYPQQQGPPQPPPGPSKTISILALVFGGAALLFSIIPVAGIFLGGLFGIAAIVLGIVGIFMSHKLFAIIGIALAVVGLIVAIIVTVALGRTAGDIIDDWPTNYEDLTDEDLEDDDTDAEDLREDEVVDGTDPDAPLPAGTEVATGTWKVTLTNVVPDATEALLAEEYNVPPAEGYQYFMFQVNAAYEGPESKFAWDDLFFGVYFDDTLYTEFCGFLPDDLSVAPEVYEGGTSSGNVCIAIPSAGAEGAVISIQEYWESGPRFFVAFE